MDFDSLYRRLDLEHPLEKQVAALRSALSSLTMNLAVALPGKLSLFTGFTDEFNRQMDEAERSDIGEVFGGQGPVAKRLKEHIAIHDWVKTEVDGLSTPNYSPRARATTVDLTDFLAAKLESFNYHPRQDPNELYMLKSFLESLRPEVSSQLFRSPGCQLTRDTNMQELDSGIYGDPSINEHFVVILRTRSKRPQDMETLVIASPQTCSMWHHHPYEGKWFRSNLEYSFEGLYSDLKDEFDKAIEKASPMPPAYDFETEVIRLAERAGKVFDEEKWLPPRLYYANHRLIKTDTEVKRPVTGYQRTQEDSLIIASVENVSLIFRDTKGHYASRIHHYMANYPVMGTSISPEEIKPEVKTALIQRAATLLAYCDIAISQQKEAA